MFNNQMTEELFAQFARIGKAISSPARIEIIYLLSQGEKSVDQLARGAKLSVANASQHLQHLKTARMVVSKKQGQQVQYRLASPSVERLWQSLQCFGKDRFLEVQNLLHTHNNVRGSLAPVSMKELRKKQEKKSVMVIDVRPEDEYLSGHLPDAVSIPLAEVGERCNDLPRDKEIIAYCRGPSCMFSYEAVEQLRNEGFKAKRLEGGFPEWKAQNLPVEGVFEQVS